MGMTCPVEILVSCVVSGSHVGSGLVGVNMGTCDLPSLVPVGIEIVLGCGGVERPVKPSCVVAIPID